MSDSGERDPTRTELQARLDRLVAENRLTIAGLFPAIGAITLVASAEGLLPPALAFQPLLLLFGTAVMRSPLLVGLAPAVDRRALALLAALCGFTWAIELVGVVTGWPYGAFEYGVSLGPMLFDAVPVALPLFFVPLVLNAYALAISLLDGRTDATIARPAIALATVVSIDLVLDPAAVAIGFWSFDAGGWYHGVPASNYVGWLLSGTVAVALVELGFDHRAVRDRLESCAFVLDDLVSFVLLWGLINALYGNVLPVIVAVGIGLALCSTDRYRVRFDRPRWLARLVFERE
ncbi:bisanhydrobacterioruberin hydratase [Halovivax limisalsi]|uniref:bisanhydrobacterioruberin hydratase n=1 Tax=Halovivax limisalsi TaxID=1453760 RepID=UPI001FFDD099|nr:bisanhydrobacterioruberin hydratase [Halovivax limisalsi]